MGSAEKTRLEFQRMAHRLKMDYYFNVCSWGESPTKVGHAWMMITAKPKGQPEAQETVLAAFGFASAEEGALVDAEIGAGRSVKGMMCSEFSTLT